MASIGPMASEEMSFENVDDDDDNDERTTTDDHGPTDDHGRPRTDDGCRSILSAHL